MAKNRGSEHDRPDDETVLTTTEAETRASPDVAVVPALTLLAHPDGGRIGERVALPLLTLGREARVSRHEPVFQAPDGSTPKRALLERSISRRPMELRGVEGGVLIDARDTRTRLIVEGLRVDAEHRLEEAELDRGAVLQLGRRVVLLLHCITLPFPENVPRFGLVGESDALLRLRRELEKLASLDVPVLLRGASGTGKELAARALHEGGTRRHGPFVAVNMATLTPSLAAAELFGAVRGAYTGADRKKEGFFQGAEGGTLFLDEIGEAPLEIQAMLLRALESREIQPVGSVEAVKVNARILAATDARLEEAMSVGNFRAPLFHRLSGYAVRLPSLRERRDDVGRLLQFFLRAELRILGTTPAADFPSSEVVARLARHDWPGNVRELRNVARRLAISGSGSEFGSLLESLEDLFSASAPAAAATTSPPLPAELEETVSEDEARLFRCMSEVSEEEWLEALRAHRWHVWNTAEALGVSRSALYRRIEKNDAVRRASDLSRAEIAAAAASCGSDVDAMVDVLQVSRRALRRRQKELGFE